MYIDQEALRSRDFPGDLQVYEGVGGAGTTGGWFPYGSGNQTGDGIDIDGRDRGHDGGGGRGGGGGREGLAEGKAATAERLGISVREVRQIPFIMSETSLLSTVTWLRQVVPATPLVSFSKEYFCHSR